jgi:PST family polysaccharide transporter
MLALTLFLTLIKNILIPLLYSSEFILAGDYLFVQMLGNVLKVAGWLIAYRMIVKKMTVQYIIVEILFTIFYVLISFHFINIYGVQGAVYGYTCAYLFYLFMVFYLINRELKFFR